MDKFIDGAKSKVASIINSKKGTETVSKEDVFVVWSCKVLQNKKAILSSTGQHQLLVEVTYSGDKNETYYDVYEKIDNILSKPDVINLARRDRDGK